MLLCRVEEPCRITRHLIDFEIDTCTDLKRAECRDFERVRNEGDLEAASANSESELESGTRPARLRYVVFRDPK